MTSERLTRDRERAIVGGVCAGIAARLGYDVTLLRVVAVLLALTGGLGFVLYLALWVLLPAGAERSAADGTAAREHIRENIGEIAGVTRRAATEAGAVARRAVRRGGDGGERPAAAPAGAAERPAHAGGWGSAIAAGRESGQSGERSPAAPPADRLLQLIDAAGVAYWRTLGITVESAEEGHVRLRMAMRTELGTRRPEVMHGGAIGSLVDAAAGAATATLRRPDDETWSGQATTDLNVTFLNAATTDVIAEGRVLRSGRSASFVSVEVHDAEGTLVAAGRATYTIMRRRDG